MKLENTNYFAVWAFGLNGQSHGLPSSLATPGDKHWTLSTFFLGFGHYFSEKLKPY